MKLFKRLSDKHYLARTKYAHYRKSLPIDDHAVFLESQQGGQFNGNVYYIAKELLTEPEYKDFKVYVSVRKNKIENAISFYQQSGLHGVTFVECFSDMYYRLAASAKYLVNDNTFLFYFVKRSEQVYLNTWHGTPLKTLGKKIANDLHNIGNAQRNFIFADYLLYQSEYMAQHMIEDYMLENLSHARYLIDGSPRNSVLLNKSLRSAIRSKYDLDNRHVIAYMPTWRGSLENKNNPITKQNLEYILSELDSRLDAKSYSVFVNLHPIESADIDFSIYKNVKQFPSEYETYEFLTAVDTLVTDYSSVFFDFAITRQKIVLYAFDKEHYLSTRGMYLSIDELPFPIAETMDQLIDAIHSPKNYDDLDFLQKYAPKDDAGSCKRVMHRFLFNEIASDAVEGSIPDNGKQNVFIYPGKLANNGITSSLKNLLNTADLSERNYILLFHSKMVKRNLELIQELSEKVNYLTIKGQMNLTLSEKVNLLLWNKGLISTERYMDRMHDAYRLELRRVFADARVDSVIHFTGYGAKQLCLFSEFPGNTVVYVHANMRFEISEKNKLREDVASYAYRHFKRIAVVSEEMIPPILDIAGEEVNCQLCENAIDYQSVQSKSLEEIDFEAIPAYPSSSALKAILESDVPKFINVGRYSIEKGQTRLLDAFKQFLDAGNAAKLVIMGGEGPEYENVINHAEELDLLGDVVFLLNVANPFPVVKRCDFSLLASYAESFGLVLAEADILGKPVFSTDIPGPRIFLKKHGGLLVEDSVEGILDGLKKCVSGEVYPMGVNYELYNQNVAKEFSGLFC